jgi:hypothetical protein
MMTMTKGPKIVVLISAAICHLAHVVHVGRHVDASIDQALSTVWMLLQEQHAPLLPSAVVATLTGCPACGIVVCLHLSPERPADVARAIAHQPTAARPPACARRPEWHQWPRPWR